MKIFPKCSLDVRNIRTLREHSANIPGILCAGWVVCLHYISILQEHLNGLDYTFFSMAIGPVFNLLTTKLSTLLFKLFTALCTFTSLSISSFSTSDFKPAKSVFLANFYLSTSVAFFKSNFVP